MFVFLEVVGYFLVYLGVREPFVYVGEFGFGYFYFLFFMCLCNKCVEKETPKSDRKWCETTPIRPIIASHLAVRPFWATTFQLAILGPHKNPSALSLVHH